MLKSKILSTLKWGAICEGKSHMTAGNEYEIRMRRNKFTCYFKYHTNINDTLSLDEIMYCLILDSDCYEFARDEYEFAREYGYDDLAEARRIYKACNATYNKLRKLFSEAEINALRSELADI